MMGCGSGKSGSALVLGLSQDEAILQSPESGLYAPVSHIMWYSKRLVKVTLSTQLAVRFVDCVEEVCDDYRDEDALPVLDISWRPWLGLWVADTSYGGIVDCLDPARDKL